ncbi:hypothetical protein HY490_04240 [Candidatus Woesearchaeota archaeon]|nr:hypothetical protein [Candidatus Woesearchaeota archaeon]
MTVDLCLENLNPFAREVFLERAERELRARGEGNIDDVAHELLDKYVRAFENAATCVHAARALEHNPPLAERLYDLSERFFEEGKCVEDAARLASLRGQTERARTLYDQAIADYKVLGFSDIADRLVAERSALPK